MSSLESELDVVVLDEKEIEEMGKTLVQGICLTPGRMMSRSGYEEILRWELQNNSVTFSYTFEEIFNKEVCRSSSLQGLPAPSGPPKKTRAKSSLFTPKYKPIIYDIKNRCSAFEEKSPNREGLKKIKPLRRSNTAQIAQHWSRSSGLRKSETHTDGYASSTERTEINACSRALPAMGTGPCDSILRVSIKTVFSVLKEPEVILIDCRFEYEYAGGHIKSAINITTKPEIRRLFNELVEQGKDSSLIIILYCEYSSVRAPRLAILLRNEDRLQSTYPLLKFPNVYVMEGGYRDFYKAYPEHCDPSSYIPM